jgi:hypothetical protein
MLQTDKINWIAIELPATNSSLPAFLLPGSGYNEFHP